MVRSRQPEKQIPFNSIGFVDVVELEDLFDFDTVFPQQIVDGFPGRKIDVE
jgi:hypothetical protein